MNQELITREIYWNISSMNRALFLALAFASMGVIFYGIFLQIRRVLKGKEKGALQWIGIKDIAPTFAELMTNRKLFRKQKKTGIMHLLFFWGFITLFIGTTLIAIEYDFFQVLLGQQGFLYGNFFLGFELILDIMGGLFLLALIYAVARRYINSSKQLRHEIHDYVFPVWLIFILITGYLVEALRISANADQLTYHPAWSPVAWVMSDLFTGFEIDSLRSIHFVTWWVHAAIVFAWFVSIPFYPKFIHIFTSVLNTLTKPSRPNGRMEKVDVEGAFERDEVLGIQKITDLSAKQRLDLISCTECGRCDMNCPALRSGKTLSPRNIILHLQRQMKQEEPLFGKVGEASPILDSSILREDIWSCTSCKACVDACPVYIDPLEKIQNLRKGEVMMNDSYPKEYTDVFAGVEKRGNPWNLHPSSRMDWAQGLDVKLMADVIEAGETVDFLYWVGCSAAFDPRNQKIARSLVQIMNSCGISFAVLGEEENCTGDALRRIGNEYQFMLQAETNVEILSQLPFKKMITTCPHCLNSLKNEYPEFGGNYEVVHHTELIGELLNEDRIDVIQPIDESITYHDPCYLGRYNQIYDSPREILSKICTQKLTEMKSNKRESMCCGAGGGMMWVEEEQGKRVNEKRACEAKQALSCGASGSAKGVVASSCPFCMTMMEDGMAMEQSIQKKDISELVASSMGLSY